MEGDGGPKAGVGHRDRSPGKLHGTTRECDRRSPIYPAEMCVCLCSALGRTPTPASRSRALCNGNRPVRGRKLHLEARQRVVHVTQGESGGEVHWGPGSGGQASDDGDRT